MGIYIVAGTVTNAIRIKDILTANKIRAVVKKNSLIDRDYGCGYGVFAFYTDNDKIVKILKSSGVNYRRIVMRNK